ncbi:RGS1-HXK1-interacting protein 1 [Silene latifolia]|uniref:RGS1-HXK1-interacting protein 1 n=1 Tax=Silene latifolia TaxID=37657 RepID=UPI003D76DAF7
MATVEGSSPSSSPSSSSSSSIDKPPSTPPIDYYSVQDALKSLEESNPWIEQVFQQAQIAQKSAEQTLDCAIAVSRSRLGEIRSTSSAHFNQTLESLKDVKAQYDAYEAKFFGKVKEGAIIAVSHPLISAGAVAGLGVLALKGPRKFLYFRTLRLFSSEEALISRADTKVKELRQSYEQMKAEAHKLEKIASQAEEEMKRGRTKLRDAGNQIRKAVRSADKIEKQARGLKDVFAELPNKDASVFSSQVSNLVSEAKRERSALSKEVKKISNYGISV